MHPVFDLHCDTPYFIQRSLQKHVSISELHKYYNGAVFAHFIQPGKIHPFVEAVKMISSTISALRDQARIKLIRDFNKIDSAKTSVLLGVEGGHIFDNDFAQVVALYELGVRVFTLTWNNSNKLAHSAFDNDKKGLTRKGKEFLGLMGEYDLIIDVSHASTKSVLDVCAFARNKIIASHSCIRALNSEFLRNISEQAIKAIAERNGVIGINVSRKHLGRGSIADHIAYLIDRFSDTVPAIGTDFDGINDPVIAGPAELAGLGQQLKGRGFNANQIEMIFSGNFLRLLENTDKS